MTCDLIIQPKRAPSNLAASRSYDNAGNPLTDGTHTYTYSADNRLTQVTQGSTTLSYAYTADGARLQKTA